MNCSRNDIKIERLTTDMLDDLCEVENVSFSVPWSRKAFEGEFDNKCAFYMAALDGKRCIGYAGMHIMMDEADIMNIAVLPDYRRCGIAQALLNSLINECKKRNVAALHLDVRETNEAAITLYEKNGFVRDGMRKNYYSDTREAAILMTKTIEEGTSA